MNPSAVFDSLAVGTRLVDVLGSVGRTEVHLFAYLSCLLALYDKEPVAEWGYSFAGTQDGAPFSPVLNEAFDTLVYGGQFAADTSSPDFYGVTPLGREELAALRTIASLSVRERYLEGACASLLSIPIGRVRIGLRQEPSLSRIAAGKHARALLEDGVALDELYSQLGALSTAVGGAKDLMVPAVVWLSYLSKTAEDTIAQTPADAHPPDGAGDDRG